MDGAWLKDLVAPGLLVLITAIAALLFGKQRYSRDRSNTQLAEAQDSEQVLLMQTMREREQDALKREREAHELHMRAREELARTREQMNGELQSLRAMGDRRDQLLTRQGKQLATLAGMIAKLRPELRDFVEESGFVGLDESFRPKRRTDASALPGPVRLDLDLGVGKDKEKK